MDDVLSIWNNTERGPAKKQSELIVPKSAIIDPYQMNGMSAGTRSKPTPTPYETLRRMAQIPAIAAVLNTRLNQVARFARRPRFEGDMGFEIVLKDPKAKMTDAARKRALEIENFFLKTGAVPNRKRKDNFNTFLRKITRDTLTLDAMAWENVPNHKGQVAEIWAMDATTIELVSVAPVSEAFEIPVYVPETRKGMKMGGADIAYIQRLQGQIVAEYSEDELAYAIRNPRTDLEYTDFGLSELEVLMEIVTGIVNGVRYNTSYFSHSHMPQGVLELVGKYEQTHLDGFKKHWQQLTSGASGKWSVPVMALSDGQGFKFTPFKNSNRDMEFNEFLEFLFNIACAVYQIDPNEVGFKSWTSNSGMTKSDNTEAKMEGSKDKGFVPLMNFLSDTFNSEVVDQIDPDFEFNWIGVDEEDEDMKLERQEKLLASGVKTIRMVWEENDVDLDKVAEDNGGTLPKWIDAPANPQLIQVYMAEAGLNQQPGEDPNADPNAEADQQQAAADDQHEKGKEMADDSHEKELEVMDKDHEQAVEMEKLKHKHALEQKKIDAKNKPKPAPASGAKSAIKKSIVTDDMVTVSLSWEDY